MAWSKVKKGKKPLGWWYLKIMCEIGYCRDGFGGMYYKYLGKMNDKYRINLYGEHFGPSNSK